MVLQRFAVPLQVGRRIVVPPLFCVLGRGSLCAGVETPPVTSLQRKIRVWGTEVAPSTGIQREKKIRIIEIKNEFK